MCIGLWVLIIFMATCSIRFIRILLQRPTVESCTTLPITGYYIHAIVTNTNGDVIERVYASNYIDDMLGGIMGCQLQ